MFWLILLLLMLSCFDWFGKILFHHWRNTIHEGPLWRQDMNNIHSWWLLFDGKKLQIKSHNFVFNVRVPWWSKQNLYNMFQLLPNILFICLVVAYTISVCNYNLTLPQLLLHFSSTIFSIVLWLYCDFFLIKCIIFKNYIHIFIMKLLIKN